MDSASRHECVIYEGASSRILSALAEVARQKLVDNYRCLYLNSPVMVAGMRCSLAAKGIDVEEQIGNGNLVLSAEQGHLVDGHFQVDRMMQTLEDSLAQALNDGYAGLWASGDMSWEFGPQKDFTKVLEYEWRLEQLLRQHAGLCGICQYHVDTLPTEVVYQGLASHRSIFVNETLSRINPHYVFPQSVAYRPIDNQSELDQMLARLCQLQQAD